jgi:hypothetical protein
MRRLRPSVLAAAFLAASFAGCVTEPELALKEAAMAHDGHGSDWSLSLQGCEEGGFVASSFQVRGGPWKQRNIRPEVGPDYLAAVPRTGNWHNGIHCAGGSFNGTEFGDFQFGWVGVGIEAPPFDPGGAAQHFILAGLGLPESEPRNALLDVINADISHSTGAVVTWTEAGPSTVVETIYADHDKGIYGGKGPIVEYRDLSERTVRFWWTVPANGDRIIHDHHGSGAEPADAPEGGFIPVYWDLTYPSATQWSSPSDRSSHTTHTGTNDHGTPMQVGPVTVPTQGETGEVNSNVVYHYPTATFSFGGMIEGVRLDYEWVH